MFKCPELSVWKVTLDFLILLALLTVNLSQDNPNVILQF